MRGMVSIAKYGPVNPYNNNLSNDELQKLKAEDLASYIRDICTYRHKIYYYGPAEASEIITKLNALHQTPAELKSYPLAKDFKAIENTENKVFFTDFDMIQANIYWVTKADPYNIRELPVASLFNEYFGGSMGSIVFQTLRESKALAYSTYSRYETPGRKDDPFFTTAFIGTQADKLNDAITGMNDLLHHLPRTEVLLENARKGIRSQIEAQRIIRSDILMNYDQALRLGNDHDVRQDVYDNIDNISMNDLDSFHRANCSDKKYTLCVLASKDTVAGDDLKQYGKLEELSLEQIFGY
jgi:predicted Zn-dependent peptidase